ncbi:MAG TPA: DUF2652 domain-containing protein [Candidatus Baltobacteraceae bacterium]|jgi:hypothetical protein|nr:DUF2652 domain-containing protein [Candidatus Baltobacteraceae bacterium]
MDTQLENAPEPLMLLIADISGYTRYMTANAKSLAHSQTIITELIKAVINQIELPLEVAKLEGDAVFLFCRKQNPSQPWPQAKQKIGGNLLALFDMFSQKIGELSRSTRCDCHACTHIGTLRIKIVVHSGEALFHRIYNFVELAGVDVILVHRLLKNSLKADQYLLLTESARRDLEFPEKIQLSHSEEDYEDIGRVNTFVYLPDAQPAPVAASASAEPSWSDRFWESWKLFAKLWFAPFTSRPGEFRHIGVGPGSFRRIGFALMTALLTPVYLPVGTVFVLLQTLRTPPASRRAEIEHVHSPDGSCCGRN